jgi:hypothetical protein
MTKQHDLLERRPTLLGLNLTRRDIFFVTALLLCTLTYSTTLYLQGALVTPEGPCFAMAETAKAIWKNGSLSSTHAGSVFEAARDLSRSTKSDVWQDVFGMDVRGNLIPKHSVISSLIAAPLFGLFGALGFWLCQQAFFVVLSYCFYRCVGALSGASIPWTSLVAICLLSPALVSSYTFGQDLHGVAFLICGLYLSRSRSFLGGLALGCAVFIRPSHILVVVPLLFAWASPSRLKGTMKVALGALCPLVLLCLYNLNFWGDPLTTVYSRLPFWTQGEMVFQRHPLGFDMQELGRGWDAKLFGGDGLFSRYWTMLTIPCAIWMALRSSHRHFFQVCFLAAFVNTIYVFSYPMWDPGGFPHRFLHPTILLLLIPFTVFVGQGEIWLRNRSMPNLRTTGVERKAPAK